MGLCLLVAICLVYTLSYWNQSLSPICGGDLFTMIAGAHGWLPYRDYYYHVPPGNIFLISWLGSLFGPKLIVVWVLGATLNILGAIALYFVLNQIAPPLAALLGTLLAFVVGVGDIAEFPFWYFHQTAAFGTFSLLALLYSLQQPERAYRAFAWNFLCGIGLGWSLAVKQTTIPVIVAFLAVPLVGSLLRPNLRRWSVASATGISLGIAVISAPIAWWLVKNGVLREFLDEVFLRGPRTKGTLLTSLLRPFAGLADFKEHRPPAMIALLLIAMGLPSLVASLGRDRLLRLSPMEKMLLAVLGCAAMLSIGWRADASTLSARTPIMLVPALATIGGFTLLAWASLAFLKESSGEAFELWIIALVGASITYSASVGWALNEVAAFPGVGIVLAVFWRVAGRRPEAERFAIKFTATALAVSFIGYAAVRKANVPGHLYGWDEAPIGLSTFEPDAPELAGFQVSRFTADFYNTVIDVLKKNVHEGDTILAYPNMEIFYGIARAKSPTFCLNHWFDICPDDVAREDARRLLRNPPAVIIATELPSWFYALHEQYFREGEVSGQRAIWDAISKLSKHYKPELEIRAPGSGMSILVMSRGTYRPSPEPGSSP